MSRKNVTDTFQTKTTRNDRFAQMSRQEQVIEQKKREIQARLQQQQKDKSTSSSSSTSSKTQNTDAKKTTKPPWKGNLGSKPIQNANNKTGTLFNIFSNDGSFLDQFKQMNDNKKFDSKNSHNSSSNKDNKREERNYNEERNKTSRWSKARTTLLPTPYEDSPPKKTSRFSDAPPQPQYHHVDALLPTPNSCGYTPEVYQNSYVQSPVVVSTVLNQCTNVNTFSGSTVSPMIIPPPIAISVPPPQINNVGLIAPPPPSMVNAPMPTMTIPPPVISVQNQITAPPPGIQTVELASIPAPNPIPVHTIPQPEPINALTIPPPAPLQLQNIPSPSPIRLNEIPNPKPIDLLNIPAPADEPKLSKSITDPDFIKNVPPPNKSVPPPNIAAPTELPNVSIPPPSTSQNVAATCLPPPIHQIPTPDVRLLNLIGTNNASVPNSNNIPALMAQPILPPPGVTHLPVRVTAPNVVSVPPPVLSQPPPLAQTNQIPPMNFPPPIQMTVTLPQGNDMNAVCPTGSASHDAMVSLGRMVAQCGSGIEDIVQQRSAHDPSLWFLFNKQSAAYQQYRQIVEQFRSELNNSNKDMNQEYQPEDIYEPENLTDDENDNVQRSDAELKKEYDQMCERKRKRKSRWGEKVVDVSIVPPTNVIMNPVNKSKQSSLLTKLTRNDPGFMQYVINTYGSTDITEEDWVKAEDHYKINLLYQDMVRKREQVERLKRAGKNKYEYDSDEETDGGTWEHKLRMQEMEATQIWANELTRQAEGKHHIGDFLPPDELSKFMEKYNASKQGRAPNLSDYKEYKLKEDNIGFKMLQKLGWKEGQGLGSDGRGIVEPINKGTVRDQNQGLGIENQEINETNDDEYDAYRKRMMLAYRFRPNPLNNPRRPYY